MFQGYRIKIHNTVFPDIFIARGSYKCIEDDRVVEIWTDANKVEHKITTGIPKATISFSIKEHDSAEHSEIMIFFQESDNIEVEYYSDKKDLYRIAYCRLEPIEFSHKNVNKSKITYDKADVKLIEN